MTALIAPVLQSRALAVPITLNRAKAKVSAMSSKREVNRIRRTRKKVIAQVSPIEIVNAGETIHQTGTSRMISRMVPPPAAVTKPRTKIPKKSILL